MSRLSRGPARFLDIAEPFDLALNAVSKHLKLLERAGLIRRQRKGREVIISLEAKGLGAVATWLHEYECFWNERLDRFQGHFEVKRKKQKKHEKTGRHTRVQL
jgi:DNA-binding transcriptional ArsR family regulator